jgi:hypothetical protein
MQVVVYEQATKGNEYSDDTKLPFIEKAFKIVN